MLRKEMRVVSRPLSETQRRGCKTRAREDTRSATKLAKTKRIERGMNEQISDVILSYEQNIRSDSKLADLAGGEVSIYTK